MGKDNQEEEESTGVSDNEILEDVDQIEDVDLSNDDPQIADDNEVESQVIESDDETTDSKS